MNINTTVIFDGKKIEQQIKQEASIAQKRLDSQVLSDSNVFCPQDTGTLQKSGILSTVLGSGKVTWNTPYAKKQYYAPFDHSHGRNPKATAKWFETAKARYLDKWIKIVEGELK